MNIFILKPTFWILLSIPIIFILGSLMHFAYNLSRKTTIVGIFTPVNESIWEHLKLSVYPTFLWYFLGFLILKNNINIYNWFFCCIISVITSAFVIVTFYYTYTGSLGIHSLFLDIFSLFLGLFIAQCLSLHIYKYTDIGPRGFYVSVLISLLIFICFTKFTFSPPKLPIFLDSVTQKYRIQK